jgi:hypothetical protein
MSKPEEVNGEDRLTPSPLVRKFGKEIVSGAADLPILTLDGTAFKAIVALH